MAGAIYVDLDGTLAHYDVFRGEAHIGKPVPHLVEYVKEAVENGWTIKIFTARANTKTAIPWVRKWLIDVFGPEISNEFEITNVKGFDGAIFIDDRAIRIEKNTGQACCDTGHGTMHWFKDNYEEKG